MLCYWAWLKQDKYWMANDAVACANATQSIKIMMAQIQVLWPRRTGVEWNLTKLHEQFHIPTDIFRHGAHANVHSGPQEHNHIQLKRAAINTQRRRHLIDVQTGERVIDRLIIQLAYEQLNDKSLNTDNHIDSSDNGISQVSSRGVLVLIEPTIRPRNCMQGCLQWSNSRYNSYPIPNQNHVLLLLYKTYFKEHAEPFVDEHGVSGRRLNIPFYSEYKRKDTSYRCHPRYRSSHAHYDWCYIQWQDANNPEEHVNIVGRLLLFYLNPDDKTIHAVVHSVDTMTQRAHGIFGTYYFTELAGRSALSPPQLFTVSVDCLESHVMMIQYKADDPNRWIHIWDQCEWPDCFQSIIDTPQPLPKKG
jgi:hypothetical protein